MLDSSLDHETEISITKGTCPIDDLSDYDTEGYIYLENYHQLNANHQNEQEKKQLKQEKIRNKAKRSQWWESIKEDVAKYYLLWKKKTHGERWARYTPNISLGSREYCICTDRSISHKEKKKTMAFHHFGI